MNEFFKSLLITTVINSGIFLLSFVLPVLFLFFFGVLVLELIIGFALALGANTRQKGGGVLVASGISFLIGFSICSSMTYGGHF